MYFLFYVLLYSITIHSPISEQQKISASKANASPTEIHIYISSPLVTIARPYSPISTVLLPAVMKKLSLALLFLILSSPLLVPFTSVKITERKNAMSTLIYQFVLSHPFQQHNHRSHR